MTPGTRRQNRQGQGEVCISQQQKGFGINSKLNQYVELEYFTPQGKFRILTKLRKEMKDSFGKLYFLFWSLNVEFE